jgi:lipopolysaccharide transport system ATP-binding protein
MTVDSYRTLRDAAVDLMAAPVRWVSDALQGKPRIRQSAEYILALRDVSFKVHQGEILGIVGRNGAGKSTLLKVLARITEPTSGSVRISGRVGALLEVGTGFHPELTGRENVFLNGAILGMHRGEIARRFDEIVAFSEVERFIDTPVKKYSSGMFLRLAFAVAAHLEPEILLVDEVLAVGDARFQRKCLGKMESVGREGRTVLFISHNMPAVTRLCPRTILLEDGAVVADGDTREVLSTYLNADRVESGGIEWNSLETAPGDDVARLRRMRVIDSEGNSRTLFTMREPIYVEVEYWLLRGEERVVPMIQVVNESGISVFVSAANHDAAYRQPGRRPGLYRSRCEIPADLMTEGGFSVDVWVRVLFPRRIFVHETNLLTFRIQDTGLGDSAIGEYRGSWGGAIAPLLKWNTDFFPGEPGLDANTPSSPVS